MLHQDSILSRFRVLGGRSRCAGKQHCIRPGIVEAQEPQCVQASLPVRGLGEGFVRWLGRSRE